MEFNDSRAIYLQIADLFLETIIQGEWKPGERIPSVREMAVNLEVNPNTVMRTFTYLQEKEIIYNKRGIGYFVGEDGLAKVKSLMQEEFIQKELPAIFRKMNILSLSLTDLEGYHKDFKKQIATESEPKKS